MGKINIGSVVGLAVIGGLSSHRYHDPRSNSEFPLRPSPFSGASFGCTHQPEPGRGVESVCGTVDGSTVHQGNKGSSTSILLPHVLSAKEIWGDKTHNRPLGSEQEVGYPQIQDGDGRDDCPDRAWRALGMLSRHCGRLSASAGRLGVPQVLRVRSGRQNLRVPGAAVRAVHGPLGFHQGNEGGQTIPSQQDHLGVFVPGRLPDSGQVPSAFEGSHGICASGLADVGIFHKLEKIQSGSPAEAGVPGRDAGPEGPHLVGPSGQDPESGLPMSVLPSEGDHDQEGVGEPWGLSQLRGKLHPFGKVASASHHQMDQPSHFHLTEGCSSQVGRYLQEFSDSLDQVRVSESPGADAPPVAVRGLDDRRITPRVERDSSSPSGGRSLGYGGEWHVHELDGIEGYSPFSPSFFQHAPRYDSEGVVRQHHCSELPEKSGIFEIGVPLDLDQVHLGVLPDPFHLSDPGSSPRCAERPSGSGIQGGSDLNRVVSRQGVFQPALLSVRSATGGSVCDERQSSVGQVRLAVPGRNSSGLGCSLSGLEQMDFHLPFSPDSGPSRGGPEVEPLPREGVPGGPILGDSQLVPSPPGAVPCLGPPSSGVLSFPDHSSRGALASPALVLPALRLEAVRMGLVRRKFSGEALEIMLQQHRESSQKQYQTGWTLFLKYLSDNDISHANVSLNIVSNFLAFQARLPKQYRTLGVYRCALKHPLFYIFDLDLDCEEMVSLRCGFFNINPPARKAPSADWALETVLFYLMMGPGFEPLESASWRCLLKKTIVLFLLASGRRISELANISPAHEWKDGRLFLQWRTGFMPKGETRDFRPAPPSLGRMEVKGDRYDVLCPVRAWSVFQGRRRRSSDLSFREEFFWPCRQKALSEMVVSVVEEAFLAVQEPAPAVVGPHQFRKFAASYSLNFLDNSPSGELRLAERMGSRSINIIKKNYADPLVPKIRVRCEVPLGTLNA